MGETDESGRDLDYVPVDKCVQFNRISQSAQKVWLLGFSILKGNATTSFTSGTSISSTSTATLYES